MPLTSLRQILDHAAEFNYGVPAFNINNMEQLLSVARAANRMDAPLLVQASRGARKYAGETMLRHMVEAVAQMYPYMPICMHQDHGNSLETCVTAISGGFSSVMMDGSLEADGKTPASFEYNVAVTKSVVDIAHMVGVSVEGELGCLGSLETGGGEKEDGHGFEGTLERDKLLTDPEEAARFVEATKVDALAVAIGTSHGAYKFTSKPTGDVLAMDVIEKIHKKLPDTHLVMHGSSSVPAELVQIINDFGGEIPETYGVPVEEIVSGIKNGVRKVNVDTDCRLAITGQVRKALEEDKTVFDPRKYLKPSLEAMQKVCEERYEQFGAAGQGSGIAAVTLEDMAILYKTGELDPSVS